MLCLSDFGSMEEDKSRRVIEYLNSLSPQELEVLLNKQSRLRKELEKINIPKYVLENEKKSISRRGFQNEGNTCYLNAVLQALKNSLYFSGTITHPFSQKLNDFYAGEEQSIVPYLQQALQSNLRRQSDAAEYFTKICQLLETEGSDDILKNIILKNNRVQWQCMYCKKVTEDTRNNQASSYYIVLSDKVTPSMQALPKALHYTRERNCKKCDKQQIHEGKRNFDVKDLILVLSDPYILDITPTIEFSIESNNYQLISVVLHKGTNTTGHYTTIINDSNKWYLCDDSIIKSVSGPKFKQYLEDWVTTMMIYRVSSNPENDHSEDYESAPNSDSENPKKVYQT